MHDVLSRAAPAPDETVRYGPGPEHVASLWWPRPGAARTAGTVLFLHGGFWRAAWDRTHAGPLAVALAEAGFTVCAPEFRRTGATRARAAGDEVAARELPGCDHFDLIDPLSAAGPAVLEAFAPRRGGPGTA